MNSYSAVRKTNRTSTLWLVVVLLLVVELLSSVVLVSRLTGFSARRQRNIISLTEPSGATKVRVTVPETPVLQAPAATFLAATVPAPSAEQPLAASFKAYDKNTVWTAETDVEIFKARYDNNGDLVYTVNSFNGDSVIAPGTQNDYSFTLANEGDASLDYTLTVECYFNAKDKNGNDLVIPVLARMYDYTGAWLVGSATQWEDPLQLNTVNKSGVLAAGKIADYTLQWQWPFERGEGDALKANDAFDTMLGNLAVDDDLEMHIIIRTRAELDEDPDHPGGDDPGTGDEGGLWLWIILAAGSLAMLIFLLFGKRGKREEEQAQ